MQTNVSYISHRCFSAFVILALHSFLSSVPLELPSVPLERAASFYSEPLFALWKCLRFISCQFYLSTRYLPVRGLCEKKCGALFRWLLFRPSINTG